jgi:hypothetical protein
MSPNFGSEVLYLWVKCSFETTSPITSRTIFSGLVGAFRGLIFVAGVGMALGLGASELFEQVGILDGGGDFVVAGGPFAEVEDAAAIGAEGEEVAGDQDDFAAGGAEESFGWSGHTGPY